MGTQARLLNLFNLNEIVEKNAKKVHKLALFEEMTNKRDLFSLFCFYTLFDIVEIYKQHSGFITFWLSTDLQNELLKKEGYFDGVCCKRFMLLITKKIPFPLVISSIQFHDFCKLLSTNCPEYDEILERYKFMGELLPQIINEARKLKLSRFAKSLIADLNELLTLDFEERQEVH